MLCGLGEDSMFSVLFVVGYIEYIKSTTQKPTKTGPIAPFCVFPRPVISFELH